MSDIEWEGENDAPTYVTNYNNQTETKVETSAPATTLVQEPTPEPEPVSKPEKPPKGISKAQMKKVTPVNKQQLQQLDRFFKN